jgi:hypothetical protein
MTLLVVVRTPMLFLVDEAEVRAWARNQLGSNPTPEQILAFAQRWEEIADSHGGDPERYREVDVIWRWVRRRWKQTAGGMLPGSDERVWLAISSPRPDGPGASRGAPHR